jgi:hypothetical protein
MTETPSSTLAFEPVPAVELDRIRAAGFDHDGRIADGIHVSGGDHALPVIRDLLRRPDVALVQLRNVAYGCYNYVVRLR